MLLNGLCPKCGSRSVRRSAGARPDGAEVPTPTGQATVPDDGVLPGDPALAPPPFGPAPVARYECDVCGYAEEWVESAADLAVIRWLVGAPPAPPP